MAEVFFMILSDDHGWVWWAESGWTKEFHMALKFHSRVEAESCVRLNHIVNARLMTVITDN